MLKQSHEKRKKDSHGRPSSAWVLEAETDLWSSGGALALPSLEQEVQMTPPKQQRQIMKQSDPKCLDTFNRVPAPTLSFDGLRSGQVSSAEAFIIAGAENDKKHLRVGSSKFLRFLRAWPALRWAKAESLWLQRGVTAPLCSPQSFSLVAH